MAGIRKRIAESSIAFGLRMLREKVRYCSLKHTKEFQESQQRLKQYRGIHAGDRCFIVATGPSLTLNDVNLLSQEITFGVNSCINMFAKTDWRPTYYCISDVNVWNCLKDKLQNAPLKNVFFEKRYMNYSKENGIPFYQNMASEFGAISRLPFLSRRKFSGDASEIIYGGASVVYIALQLAVLMGFRKIYLLGVDCNYSSKNAHSKIAKYDKQPRIAFNAVSNMVENFKIAKAYADQNGIEIYNATRGGNLEVFERVKLEDVLEGKENENSLFYPN